MARPCSHPKPTPKVVTRRAVRPGMRPRLGFRSQHRQRCLICRHQRRPCPLPGNRPSSRLWRARGQSSRPRPRRRHGPTQPTASCSLQGRPDFAPMRWMVRPQTAARRPPPLPLARYLRRPPTPHSPHLRTGLPPPSTVVDRARPGAAARAPEAVQSRPTRPSAPPGDQAFPDRSAKTATPGATDTTHRAKGLTVVLDPPATVRRRRSRQRWSGLDPKPVSSVLTGLQVWLPFHPIRLLSPMDWQLPIRPRVRVESVNPPGGALTGFFTFPRWRVG